MYSPREILGNLPGGRVLDVATGSGSFISFLVEGLGSYKTITGIDISEKSAAAFTEAFAGKANIRFMHMDASRMEFPDGFFDTVCISNSLHHMADLPAVLLEMLRVLRPGGRFIVSEMFKDAQTETQMTHVLMHHWWAAVDTARGVTHLRTFTRREILDLLTGLDLQEVAVHDLADLGEDPRDPETVKTLTGVVDQYLQRIEGLPQETGLRTLGLELRQRVRQVGFHSATTLLFVGRKISGCALPGSLPRWEG